MNELEGHMSEAVTNFRRGTTEMILLAMLTQREWYATELTQALTEKCPDTFNLLGVHIAQIMRRLRDAGFVDTRIQPSENGRLKYIYYRLLPKGEAYLKEMVCLYRQFDRDITAVLAETVNKQEGC